MRGDRFFRGKIGSDGDWVEWNVVRSNWHLPYDSSKVSENHVSSVVIKETAVFSIATIKYDSKKEVFYHLEFYEEVNINSGDRELHVYEIQEECSDDKQRIVVVHSVTEGGERIVNVIPQAGWTRNPGVFYFIEKMAKYYYQVIDDHKQSVKIKN